MALQATWGFAILGQDVVIFIISNMAAVVRAGQTSVGFWLLSCTFVFQSAAVPGGRFSNSPTSQSPVRWLQPFFDNFGMTTGKIIGYIGLVILIAFGVFVFSFVRSCNNGFGYQAGSGLGSLVDIDKEKYKSEYVEQYVDTFFKVYPEYLPTPGDLAKSMTSGYEFLNMTNIYFDKYPRETYCVQWDGTGFISVRFAYNYETRQEVIENIRANSIIADSTKERMTKRLRTEVLDKIDSIIAKSKDSTIAIWKSPF